MSKKIQPPEKQELIEKYEQKGVSISDLAKIYSTSNPTVRKWLIDYGIPRKSQAEASRQKTEAITNKQIPDKEELKTLYYKHSLKFLENYYRAGQKRILEWIDYHQIPRKTLSQACTIGKQNQHSDIQFSKEYLIEQYEKDKPLSILADKLGVSYSHTKQLCKKYDIAITKTWRSKPEIELYDFCASSFSEYSWEHSDRTILGDRELDIVNHHKKIAIEYCGLYWHSQHYGNKERGYHRKKTVDCSKKGYKLITVFESDDQNKVRSLINKLHGKTKKIGARNTKAKSIDTKTASDFHNKHHLHNNHSASIHYGLYDKNEELVMVLSMGASRFSKSHDYECIRMTSHSEYSVIGGASKLFSRFIDDHKPDTIITFADLRFGDGKVYDNCGFQFKEITAPNYWYYHKYSSKLHSRQKYQKHKLTKMLDEYDENLTEYDNMLNNGFDRIWDCGNAKYVWNRSEE
jgi:transposase-like protein